MLCLIKYQKQSLLTKHLKRLSSFLKSVFTSLISFFQEVFFIAI